MSDLRVPMPWGEVSGSEVFKEAPTEKKLTTLNNWSKEYADYIETRPNYSPKMRTENTNFLKKQRAKIESGETVGEKAGELGRGLVDSLKGSAGGLAVSAAVGSRRIAKNEGDASFDTMVSANLDKIFDRFKDDRNIAGFANPQRFDELKKQGFKLSKSEDGKIDMNVIDRRQKVDESLSAFKTALDNGDFPDKPADFARWLNQQNDEIVGHVNDYTGGDAKHVSRKFRYNTELTAALTDYMKTRNDASFAQIVQRMTESDTGKTADEDIAEAKENPDGVLKFAKDKLSEENFDIVADAATDPVEAAANALSLALSAGTGKAAFEATKAFSKEGMKQFGKTFVKNTLTDVPAEAATEAFQAFVENERADLGDAAANGAIMALAFQATGATAGGVARGATSGAKAIGNKISDKVVGDVANVNVGNLDGVNLGENATPPLALNGDAPSINLIPENESTSSSVEPQNVPAESPTNATEQSDVSTSQGVEAEGGNQGVSEGSGDVTGIQPESGVAQTPTVGDATGTQEAVTSEGIQPSATSGEVSAANAQESAPQFIEGPLPEDKQGNLQIIQSFAKDGRKATVADVDARIAVVDERIANPDTSEFDRKAYEVDKGLLEADRELFRAEESNLAETQNLGPGAANVEEVFEEIPDGYAERASFETVQKAVELGDIDEGIVSFLPQLYKQESRSEWVNKAMDEVGAEGTQVAHTKVKDAFDSRTHKAKDTAKLALLTKNYQLQLKKAEAAGDTKKVAQLSQLQEDLVSSYMEAQTDIARTLNSGYFIRHLTPEGQLRALQKATKNIGKRKRKTQEGEDAEIKKASQKARKSKGNEDSEKADSEAEKSAESVEKNVDDIIAEMSAEISQYYSDTLDLTESKKNASDLALFLRDSRIHSNGKDTFQSQEEFFNRSRELEVDDDVAANLWNSITKGNSQNKSSRQVTKALRDKERSDARLDVLLNDLLTHGSDTPNLVGKSKAAKKKSLLSGFIGDIKSRSKGNEKFESQEQFRERAKEAGVDRQRADSLWNASSKAFRDAEAVKTAKQLLGDPKRSDKRVDGLIEKILTDISDTPDLRKQAKKQTAISSFLRDVNAHARGSSKFETRQDFFDKGKRVGVNTGRLESLWNASSKAFRDAETANAVRKSMKEAAVKRRKDFIAQLERQFGKRKAAKIFRKKAKMIDALLEGKRPDDAVKDFYEGVDLTSEQRQQVLDILQKAEGAQGVFQAQILDEAKKILNQSIPPQYIDALFDSFRAGLFSGSSTQSIAWVSGIENVMANLVGSIVTDLQKAKSEGLKFGRTKSRVSGIFSKDTAQRAKVAVDSILSDLPIDDHVSRFGSGDTLKSLLDRDDVHWGLTPWLMQHWVYKGMGVPDQTIKSFVFRSEAGVLAYEKAIDNGKTSEQALEAVVDQQEKFATEIFEDNIKNAEAEFVKTFGVEPETRRDEKLINLRALEMQESMIDPDIRQSALDRGNEFNYMAQQPDDFLGAKIATPLLNLLNASFETNRGSIRPLRLIAVAFNVMVNALRVGTDFSGLGLLAGYNTAYSLDRQRLAFNRAKAGLALSVGSLALVAMSRGIRDDDPEDDFIFEIHGRGPSDPKLRNALMSTGWKPFSLEVKMPGQKRSVFKRFGEGPMAFNLGLIGNALDSERYGEITVEEYTDWVQAIGPAMSNQGRLVAEIGPAKMVSDVVALLSADDSYGKSHLENVVGTITNIATATALPFSSAQRDIANLLDPGVTNKSNLMGNIQETVPGAKILWGDFIYDQWGRKIERTKVKAIDRFISVEKTDDEVSTYLIEKGVALSGMIRSGTGNTSIAPQYADKKQLKVVENYITKDGNSKRMTRAQYENYFRQHRQKLKTFLDQNVDYLKTLPDEDVKGFIDDAKTVFSNGQKLRMMDESEMAKKYESSKSSDLLSD